ncbi:hypothetical protein HK096_000347 [Nowakowskiella sp. JEL0078]|nr:hypothetical protein HK096_000347 [Nowakowskiella sp. JEL0078]
MGKAFDSAFVFASYFGQRKLFRSATRAKAERHKTRSVSWFGYQVGATPELTEEPKCTRDDDCLELVSKMSDEDKPKEFSAKDPKWRFFWRIGSLPADTKYTNLNAQQVRPFSQAPELDDWDKTMDSWGGKLHQAVLTFSEMLCIGLGIPRTTISKMSTNGPHLLAPTGSDLQKYNKEGTVLAGFHTDLNCITIHGKSRYPGLSIWVRSGRKLQVQIPSGCLLVQAGKQLEYLTGGYIKAGYHEVVVTNGTLEAIERQKQKQRPLWRISSTLFFHIASDQVLKPLKGIKWVDENPNVHEKYQTILTGEQVLAELGLIKLMKIITTMENEGLDVMEEQAAFKPVVEDISGLKDNSDLTFVPDDSMDLDADDSNIDNLEESQEIDNDVSDALTPSRPKKRRGRPPRSTPVKVQKSYSSMNSPASSKLRLFDPDCGIHGEDMEESLDLKGELKVNKDGILSGGRQYKARTWVLPRHPTKLYMLGMDVSKALGFRDSYIFFLRNPKIHRLHASDFDRQFLLDNGIPPNNLRSKNVPIVTARSIFRAFGHKCIRRGRSFHDDYFVGEQPEPAAADIDEEDDEYYDATLGTGSFTGKRVEAPATPSNSLWRMSIHVNPVGTAAANGFGAGSVGENVDAAERDKWMHMNAVSCAEFNAKLKSERKRSFWDVHTGLEMHPQREVGVRVEIEVGVSAKLGTLVVDSVDKKSKGGSWVGVWEDGKSGLYPLSISSGQFQDVWSIYPTRFETAKPEVHQEVAEPEPMQPPLELNYPNNNGTPICDIKIKDRLCGRVVSAPHEKCFYHQKKPSNLNSISLPPSSPVSEVKCVHCHNTTAPKHDTDKGATIPTTLTLKCMNCKKAHHPRCIDIADPVIIYKAQTYSWQCNNCKICTLCNAAGDDAKMLFCDTCDRGYHMDCLDPPLTSLPVGAWLCSVCTVCTSCEKGAGRARNTHFESEDKWCHALADDPMVVARSGMAAYMCTYCETCYASFIADRFCPLCLHVYAEDELELAMACCDSCDRWIHVGCDPDLTVEAYQALTDVSESKYTCVLCDLSRTLQIVERGIRSGREGKVVEYKGKRLIAPPAVIRTEHP